MSMEIQLQPYLKNKNEMTHLMEYQTYDKSIKAFAWFVNYTDTTLTYDPVILKNYSIDKYIMTENDVITVKNVEKYGNGCFLTHFNYTPKHLLPIFPSNKGVGLPIKERGRHRICPICHKVYDVKISDLKRGRYATCGDELCKSKYKKFSDKGLVDTRECFACGNTFPVVLYNEYESTLPTLDNSFCTQECILNCIPEETFFTHKQQYTRYEEGLTDEYITRMYNVIEDDYIKLFQVNTKDEVLRIQLGKVVNSYGKEMYLYDMIK